jgi:hypothetical protein
MKPRETQIILLILSICLLLTLILAIRNNLQRYNHAPVAQTPPGRCQVGKVEIQNPGGTFESLQIFKHNVFFSDQERTKLIPILNQCITDQHGNRISFGNTMCMVISFNIIYIIALSFPNYIWHTWSTPSPYNRHIHAVSCTILRLGFDLKPGQFLHNVMLNTKRFVSGSAGDEQEQRNVYYVDRVIC